MRTALSWIAVGFRAAVGCRSSAPDRPAAPPAHGYRRKHAYCYYPNSSVYYDPIRKIYFTTADDGWKFGAELPASVVVEAHEMVTVEVESETPYVEHDKHKAKYPPGQLKKKKDK